MSNQKKFGAKAARKGSFRSLMFSDSGARKAWPASRQPIEDLEKAIGPTRLQSPSASIQFVQLDSSGIAGLRSRDLVLTKEKTDNKNEHAIYVANAKDPKASVIAQFD